MKKPVRLETRVVHAGADVDPRTGAIMVPIYQTSTYVQDGPGEHRGWDYSRAGNPSRDALEKALGEIESAQYGLAFSSGLAAEQALMQLLEPGDEVVVCDDVYGGTGRLFRTLYAKYGIQFNFVDMTDPEQLAGVCQSKTKMFWIESPSNPLMKVIDISAVRSLADQTQALVVVDNTFATPVWQSPLDLGADVVVHSTTKYIGGHSDVIGGAVMVNDNRLYEKIRYIQFAAGAVPGPFECFMLHRSIKTLGVRMEKHQSNAFKVAEFLESRLDQEVERVFFPGLESHPQYELAKKQMRGHSGMVSFRLKGDLAAVQVFLSKLQIFQLAESLGGVESLVNHPELMTHASVPEDMRQELGIDASLIRLSVGIESPDDLIDDLKQALGAALG